MKKRGNKIFNLLACILEPPAESTGERISQAGSILERLHPGAKDHLECFREFCLTHPPGCLREIHAETFSGTAGCCPYVGHHLFSTDQSRILFAEKLKADYSIPGSRATEVPDHITEMLKSLAAQASVEEAREMIDWCLIPAVRKMIGVMDCRNPYRAVLQAVLLILEQESRIGCADRTGVYALA